MPKLIPGGPRRPTGEARSADGSLYKLLMSGGWLGGCIGGNNGGEVAVVGGDCNGGRDGSCDNGN